MPAPDDEFEQIIQGLNAQPRCDRHPNNPENPMEIIDTTPYGIPVQRHKTGLTKRGKAALAIGATVIASGSLISYQAYSANAAEAEQKAQELAVQSQALELEKLRELNRANEANRKAAAGEDKARQASVDACIKHDKTLVGKGFGSPSYRDVIDACQTQYAGTPAGLDMEAAASTQDTNGADGGGVNQGLLIGVGALGLIVIGATKFGRRSNPA